VELTDVGPARAVDDRGRAIVGLLDLQVQRRWEVDGSFTLLPVPDPSPPGSVWTVRMSPGGWIVADLAPGDAVVVWDPSLAVSVRTGVETVASIDDDGRVAGTAPGGAFVELAPDGSVTPASAPPAWLDLDDWASAYTEDRSPNGAWLAIGLAGGSTGTWPGVGPTLEDARRLSCGEGETPVSGRARAVNDRGLVVGSCAFPVGPERSETKAVAWLPPPAPPTTPPPPSEAPATTVPPTSSTGPSSAAVAVPVRATPRFTG
jgi:hypothetical protein